MQKFNNLVGDSVEHAEAFPFGFFRLGHMSDKWREDSYGTHGLLAPSTISVSLPSLLKTLE